jgi:hypothetical protein
MNGTQLAFLAIAFGFAACLAYGLYTASMPAKPGPVARSAHPTLFRVWAGILALFTAMALAAAIASN